MTLAAWLISSCNYEQIPLDQVHKYLELLHQQRDEEDNPIKELSMSGTSDSSLNVSLAASSTSNATVVSLTSPVVAAIEKTELIQSTPSDSRYESLKCYCQM